MKHAAPLLAALLLGALAGAVAMRLLAPPPARLGPAAAGLASPELPRARGHASDPAAPAAAATIEATRDAAPAAPSTSAAVSRPAGERRIDGRIAFADGSGVASAVVRATRLAGLAPQPREVSAAAGAPPLEPLEDALRRASDAWHDRAARTWETRSDAEGRFAFDALPDGRYSLAAWHDGAFVAPAGRGGEVVPDATFDFVARPAVRVEVDVRLPDGTRAERAALHLATTAGGRAVTQVQAWSAAAPELRLEPGRHSLSASLGDPEAGPPWPDLLASETVELDAIAGAPSGRVELCLAGVRGIRGRIVGGAGVAAAALNGIVRVAPAPATGQPDLNLLLQGAGGMAQQWVQRGEFVVRHLAAGRYVVGFSRNWNEPVVAHAVVEVGEGMAACDLVVPASDSDSVVAVELLDPEGRPLSGASFEWMVQRPEGGSTSAGITAEPQPDGSWRVPLTVVESLDLTKRAWGAEVTVKLAARHERYGRKVADVAPSTRALRIRFEPPARLRATIAGYAGSGYEGRLSLELQAAGEGATVPQPWGARGVGADGVQELGPVASGDYVLWLRVQGRNRWEQRRIARRELRLLEGDNAAAIDLPALSDLVVEVPGATAGSLQLEHKANDEYFHAELDAQGRASFVALAPGEYVAQFHGRGELQMMRIRVPAVGVVRFEPMVVNAVRVVVHDRGGKLAQLGFRDGDLIVGLDGREFASSGELQASLMQALAKQEVAFVLLRGRDRIELRADPRALLDPRTLGGELEPATR